MSCLLHLLFVTHLNYVPLLKSLIDADKGRQPELSTLGDPTGNIVSLPVHNFDEEDNQTNGR